MTPKAPEASIRSPPSVKPRSTSSDHPFLPFSNGTLKRHHPPPSRTVFYRECLRNHAAALGGLALDGCGEFMPSPLSTPSDPTSIKCAACGCHRNFHRRADDDGDDGDDDEFTPTKRPSSHSPTPAPPLAASSPFYPSAPHILMALSAGLSGPDAENMPATPNSTGRKRFRTKFSKEQKERMYEFAEKLGWRMQKKDDEAVEEFCKEVGIGKVVLKVWMHNNKHAFLNKDKDRGGMNGLVTAVNGIGPSPIISPPTNVNADGTAVDNNTTTAHHHHHEQHPNSSSSSGTNGINGSSSSS